MTTAHPSLEAAAAPVPVAPPIPAYVPLHVVAKQLGVDGKTLRLWSRAKKFPALHRAGHLFFVALEELQEWHRRFRDPGDLASRMKAAGRDDATPRVRRPRVLQLRREGPPRGQFAGGT